MTLDMTSSIGTVPETHLRADEVLSESTVVVDETEVVVVTVCLRGCSSVGGKQNSNLHKHQAHA
jgi:hypothetical protein